MALMSPRLPSPLGLVACHSYLCFCRDSTSCDFLPPVRTLMIHRHLGNPRCWPHVKIFNNLAPCQARFSTGGHRLTGSGDRKACIFGDHYFANCPSFSELPSQILTESLRLLAISGDSITSSIRISEKPRLSLSCPQRPCR